MKDETIKVLTEWYESKDNEPAATVAIMEIVKSMKGEWELMDILATLTDTDLRTQLNEVIIPMLDRIYKARLILDIAGLDE